MRRGGGWRRGLGIAAGLALVCASTAGAEVGRIVSLAPSLTESVFALGLGDRLVGVSTYCDYPAEARRIDRVGTFLTPNVEAIVAKRPDLVLVVPSPGNRMPVDSLQRLGLEVRVFDPNRIAEVEQMLMALGRELDREQRARALVAELKSRREALRARLAGAPPRKVLMVLGQTPLVAVGSETLPDELIRLAGGLNVAAAASGPWPRLSLEFAIASAPEVIIDTTMGDEERAGAAPSSDFWKAFPVIPAVRHGRIYGYRQYELLRPGPRIIDALEDLARYIHPERFEGGG